MRRLSNHASEVDAGSRRWAPSGRAGEEIDSDSEPVDVVNLGRPVSDAG